MRRGKLVESHLCVPQDRRAGFSAVSGVRGCDTHVADLGDIRERGVPNPVRADVESFRPRRVPVDSVEQAVEPAAGEWMTVLITEDLITGAASAALSREGTEL